VTEYSLVHHLGEEAGLRSQFLKHVWNILLSIWGERLLVASASSKRNDDDFSLLRRSLSIDKGTGAGEGTAKCKPSRSTQKFASGEAQMTGHFVSCWNRLAE
jgi:hypothetical protein